MSEEELKNSVPADEYTDTLGYMEQQSAGFWLICILIAGCGLAGLYIVLVEVLSWYGE
jgi:CHASE3 domain sensor protein